MISANDFVAALLAQRGTPYLWGGESLGVGVDCSGLIYGVMEGFGVKGFPRTSGEQISHAQPIPLADGLRIKGSPLYHPGHIVISLGDGRCVEAAHTGTDVKVSSAIGRFTSAGLFPEVTYGKKAEKSGLIPMGSGSLPARDSSNAWWEDIPVVGQVGTAVKGIGDVVGWLYNEHGLLRIAEVVLGFGALILGGAALMIDETPQALATKTAGKAVSAHKNKEAEQLYQIMLEQKAAAARDKPKRATKRDTLQHKNFRNADTQSEETRRNKNMAAYRKQSALELEGSF